MAQSKSLICTDELAWHSDRGEKEECAVVSLVQTRKGANKKTKENKECRRWFQRGFSYRFLLQGFLLAEHARANASEPVG